MKNRWKIQLAWQRTGQLSLCFLGLLDVRNTEEVSIKILLQTDEIQQSDTIAAYSLYLSHDLDRLLNQRGSGKKTVERYIQEEIKSSSQALTNPSHEY